MNLIDRITGISTAPNGNLDDELEAEARIKALANSPVKIPIPMTGSPFSPAPEKQASFSLKLTPSVKGLSINTSHPLESTVEEVGGRVTISIKW
jgi:hypothetical protein